MRRFFVEPELISNDEIAIIGELEHYLSDVLRLKIGALIELSDGEKEICTVKLTEFAAGVIKGEISERRAFSKSRYISTRDCRKAISSSLSCRNARSWA